MKNAPSCVGHKRANSPVGWTFDDPLAQRAREFKTLAASPCDDLKGPIQASNGLIRFQLLVRKLGPNQWFAEGSQEGSSRLSGSCCPRGSRPSIGVECKSADASICAVYCDKASRTFNSGCEAACS